MPPAAAHHDALRVKTLTGRHHLPAHIFEPERPLIERKNARVAHAAGLSDEFIDWFAVAGPPKTAVERLSALKALGLDFLWMIPGSTGMPHDLAAASLTSLAKEVAPTLRQ